MKYFEVGFLLYVYEQMRWQVSTLSVRWCSTFQDTESQFLRMIP